MKIKVSDLIVRYMERLGIQTIYGMPGAHILPVYDSLYDSSIQTVLAKHEQGAAFMACGDARASGAVAACITTAGPGATNLVTGIANAFVEKQPVLIISGETSTYIFGRGGLQESSGEGGSIDQSAIFSSITKYHKMIERTDYLVNVLNQTSSALLADDPAPVLLSIPFNLQTELVDASLLDEVKTKRPLRAIPGASPAVDEVARLIADAERPVIVAGYGCVLAGAQGLISELSSRMNIPVTSSLKGKGVISEQAELSLGSLGVTSSGFAYNYMVEQSDLIIILGAGFNERTSYLWNQKLLQGKRIVQIDHNPAQLEKVFKADVAIADDLLAVLTSLVDVIAQRGISAKAMPDLSSGNSQSPGASKGFSVFKEDFSLVESFYRRLSEHFPENLQVFDDNIIFAQNFFSVASGNRYYPNTGVSSLGYAIPAAIGARFAEPKPTMAILGDGGFQMCCMEIMTAVNYKMPLTIVMFNNSTMGLIRKNQHQQYEDRYIDCDFVNPDYAFLAKSFGINFQRISTEDDLDVMFTDTNFEQAINLVEIMIDKDAFPTYRSGR